MITAVEGPYERWLRNENRKEARLSKCPICAMCEEPIQEEYGYRLDGELYCWNCALDWLHGQEEYIDIDEDE